MNDARTKRRALRALLDSGELAAVPGAWNALSARLIEEGRDHLLLRAPIGLDCPVRLIHGSADEAVPWETSLKLMAALESEDVEVLLVKGGDHRLSEPQDLARLFGVVSDLLDRGGEIDAEPVHD